MIMAFRVGILAFDRLRGRRGVEGMWRRRIMKAPATVEREGRGKYGSMSRDVTMTEREMEGNTRTLASEKQDVAY